MVKCTLEQAVGSVQAVRHIGEGMEGQRHARATLYPGKYPVPIVQEAGCAPGPVWTRAEYLAPRVSISGPFVASRYTD